ncbi:MAG: LysR family transcriptional regulator [Sphingomonadales bacterium]|nr:LysR family transcriptional regulator [Sphingomonadales bacterium]
MSDLSTNELRRIDLTLLLVFLGLLKHRKAALVAAELGLTQSAISQALKRLRDILGDELFLRRPHGMEPTALALSLENPILTSVELIRGAVGQALLFEPATAKGVVRIAALDAEQAVLLPPFAEALRREAPGLQLSVLPLGRQDAVGALLAGEVDLAVGYIWNVPANIHQHRLYVESFHVAGLARRFRDQTISLDDYCAANHILVSPAGDLQGIVDDKLAELGQSRSIAMALPSFIPAMAAAAASDCLITLPSRIALAFAGRFGMNVVPSPIAIRSFPISLFWHARNQVDPRSVWLRQMLIASSNSDPTPSMSNHRE